MGNEPLSEMIRYAHSQKIGNTNNLSLGEQKTKEQDDRLILVLNNLFIDIYK